MSLDQLPPFVRRHLDTIAQLERFVSYECTHQAGSKPGDGFMAMMVAIELRGPRLHATDGDDIVRNDSLSLMCKLLPASIERQEQFQMKALFEREAYFYGHLRPLLDKFQTDHGLTAASGFFAYPQCYVAVADAAAAEYVIIMRDLRPSGYQLWEKSTPQPFATVQLLFEQLGRLAGVSLAMREQRPDLFADIERLNDLYVPLITSENMQKMVDETYDKSLDMIDGAEHKEMMQWIRQNWLNVMSECTEITDAYAVLGHGDSWNNNMMFEGQNKICLLDWQVCRFASPALDIVYFLFSSTDRALRQQFDRLLHIYHENLAEVVRVCGCDADKLMPFAELENQLRRFGRFGVALAPMMLQVIVSDASHVVDMDEVAQEMAKSDADRKQIEWGKFDAETLARYRERLGDVIDDAKRFGWI